ncbi:MAG: Glycosyltransferase (EC [uncultured Sulfurovum sp.]|uniref:Glycosyltransferase (EC) n=1 Tax=uncultured Sulfurovum sp. TaxID=269237 RepID=A0A6S6TT80_9BACT|nr:MAG: Glycosyltransferase (EC [uncultured Sulfurovum sp.]
MMKKDTISIIIPCLNEEHYIANCIESIIHSDIDFSKTELIFVDGNSSDKTVEIINKYIQKYPFIQVFYNPKKFTPISMNMGIKASTGEYIFVLSAHAKYEKNYFSKLLEQIEILNADCVGGVLLTEVKNKNRKSNSIKEILTHKFGVGNASFRTGSSAIQEVDTVAFGCYRKEVFEKYGFFDERLIRNQDIELNKRIVNGGGKIYLIPQVRCIYYARDNFRDLAKNNYSNGFWNILTAYYTKTLNSLSLRHFIPLIFLLSLVLPTLLSLLIPQMIWMALFSLSSYLALVIIISFKLKENNNNFFYLIGSFLTLHLSYGWGSLMGIFSLFKKY